MFGELFWRLSRVERLFGLIFLYGYGLGSFTPDAEHSFCEQDTQGTMMTMILMFGELSLSNLFFIYNTQTLAYTGHRVPEPLA